MDEDKRKELVELLDKKSLHYIEVIPFDESFDELASRRSMTTAMCDDLNWLV